MYVGRFAPSPTGALHYGSLVAALASYLDARASHGRWLLRIEDADPPREVAGSAAAICRTLERLGLEWDGPVEYQSTRSEHYQTTLERLRLTGLIYPCSCSRAKIARTATRQSDDGPVYPGTCRPNDEGQAPDATLTTPDLAWRLRTDRSGDRISFHDRVQGPHSISASQEMGDFVLRRRDRLFAYQLAVAVDDAQQGITHVVRGIDLLRSTFRQVLVMRHIGATLPQYAHIPIVVDASGAKLSKRDAATPVDHLPPNVVLVDALSSLMQAPPSEIRRSSAKTVLSWAVDHWTLSRLSGLQSVACHQAYL